MWSPAGDLEMYEQGSATDHGTRGLAVPRQGPVTAFWGDLPTSLESYGVNRPLEGQ